MKAQVFRSAKRVFTCKTETGDMIEATSLRELIKGRDTHIAVGDHVTIDDDGVITEVEERKTEIFRILPRTGQKKTIAANCDLLLIVCSVSQPQFKRGLLDRYLIRSEEWQIPALVIFNKMDQFDPEEGIDLEFEYLRVKPITAGAYEISAHIPDRQPQILDQGLAGLKDALRGKTAIMLGQSGVGKSRLITALSDGKLELKSQSIGKVGKGTHTTTWAEIVDLGDFQLIDSPGIRSFSIDDISEKDLMEYFPDLLPHTVKCQFTTCEHTENSKGCFFQGLSEDKLDELILLTRLDSYFRIKEDLAGRPDWEKNSR